jgi:5-methylthioadenosine/S-adenosylhomocysteine deaminase
VSDQMFSAVARLAAAEGIPIAVHIAESDAEAALVTRGEGPFVEGLRGRGIHVSPRARSAIQLLENTGVLGERTLCIHAVHADEADIDLLTRRGASVAHCPISNARLGHGSAPLAEFLDAGIAVGLGSDSMASNDRMHMLEEARAAALVDRLRRPGDPALSPAAYLELATLGGARALGLDSVIGSLEPGKQADLAAFPLGAAIGAARYDPEAAALYSLGATAASFVAVCGEPLVAGGRLLREDPKLGARVGEATAALALWRRDEGRTSS